MNNGESIQFKVHGYGKLLKFKELQKIPPRCRFGWIRVIEVPAKEKFWIRREYWMRYEDVVRKFR